MKTIKDILQSEVSDQQKVSDLLELDSALHTNLGLESTEKERKEVRKQSDRIIDEVVKLDPELKYLKTAKDR